MQNYRTNSAVRSKVTVAVAVFVLFNLFVTLAHAAVAMRGQLSFQLQTAGAPVVVDDLSVGQAYKTFETQLMKNIDNGTRSIEIIRTLEQASLVVWEHISNRVSALLIKKPGDELWDMLDRNPWVSPLFQYVEGGEEDVPAYAIVNKDLRTGNSDSEDTIKWVTEMRQSLSRLPKYQGFSFRGTRLTKNRIDKYYPLNGLAEDAAFISSSVNLETAQKFARLNDPQYATAEEKEEISVLFVIKGHTGRPVSSFARMHSHEAEILFSNGTPFRVVAKSPVFDDSNLGGRSQIIVLHEL